MQKCFWQVGKDFKNAGDTHLMWVSWHNRISCYLNIEAGLPDLIIFLKTPDFLNC